MIVGVTGFFCAGKDTVAEILTRRGFPHVSLSDIIRDEIRRRGEEISIPRLTEVGNELRARFGPGVLAERALAVLPPGGPTSDRPPSGNPTSGDPPSGAPMSGDAVVTSIRHSAEVETLRQARPDFRMVFVDAPIRVRYERSLARRRQGDPMTFDEFRDAERAQMEGADPNGQQLLKCRDMADCVVENDGALADLEEKVERLVGDPRMRPEPLIDTHPH